MAAASMRSNLPAGAMKSRRKDDDSSISPELALGDIPAKRAAKTDEARDALRWAFTRRIAPYFDRAVEVYLRDLDVKAFALAEEMTVPESTLSLMRAGKRLINTEQLEVLKRHRPSRLILASADADRPAVTLAAMKDKAWEVLIEDANRGDRGANAILDEAARRLGIERGDADAVIERGEEDEHEEPAPLLNSAEAAL